MKILLTEGSGLTSRQVAARLAADGHEVGVLTSDPNCLCRFTRDVRRLHRVPRFGADPQAWWEAARSIHREHGYDLLLPTQEQVTVLSTAAAVGHDDRAGGDVTTVVPPFTGLAAVFDKVSAASTLARIGVPAPPTTVLRSPPEVAAWRTFPVFAKAAVGTASSSVRRVASPGELADAVAAWGGAARLARDGVVVQEPVSGPLVMVQTVFDHGRLVAAHANLRVLEGARGGTACKRSIVLPDLLAHLERLGRALDWHGALSADAVAGPDGPLVIDVNPRLVEPMNAWWAGVDLVGAMVRVARGEHPDRQPAGRPDVVTRQLLIALLGSSQHGGGRRDLVRLLRDARHGRGAFAPGAGSAVREELRSVRRDPLGTLPAALALATGLVAPSTWQWFATGSVEHYAIGPDGWHALRQRVAERGGAAERPR